MPKSQTNPGWDLLVELDAVAAGPLHERLKRALRTAIRSGRIPVSATLPPSRVLAGELGCSRWAVTEAYAQLTAEGYLAARTGSGTRVRWAGPAAETAPTQRRGHPGRARMDLAPGLPDLRGFPRAAWGNALRAAALNADVADLGYAEPAGHHRLRAVLVEYLQRSRAASPAGAQLTVTTSTTSSVRRLCLALAADGHRTVAVENPGWTPLVAAAREAGLDPVLVDVDADGLRVPDLHALRGTRAVLVTPAHQFPLGVVLSPERRTALLRWADEVDGLVLEDDYDAEFRYDRRPVATLQGMTPRRVALLGSLSKSLSPAVRLGWMLLPDRWATALHDSEQRPPLPPTLDQMAFAALLDSGAYDRHLRLARRTYRARRDLLLEQLARRMPDGTVSGAAAGLHLLLHLPAGVQASRVVRAAAAREVHIVNADQYRHGAPGAPGLVLGYGNIRNAQIPEAVSVLADVVARQRRGTT
jgi:GntR family transcriptional regulator/MocR family aminotransferase